MMLIGVDPHKSTHTGHQRRGCLNPDRGHAG